MTCDCCGAKKVYADDQCADCYLVSRRQDYTIDILKDTAKLLGVEVSDEKIDEIESELFEWLANYGQEEFDIRSGNKYIEVIR